MLSLMICDEGLALVACVVAIAWSKPERTVKRNPAKRPPIATVKHPDLPA